MERLLKQKFGGAPTRVDKQHRMVCYNFFEKLFDVMMIDPNVNLSQRTTSSASVGTEQRIIEI